MLLPYIVERIIKEKNFSRERNIRERYSREPHLTHLKFFLCTHLYPYLHFVKNFRAEYLTFSVPIPNSVVKTYPTWLPTGQVTRHGCRSIYLNHLNISLLYFYYIFSLSNHSCPRDFFRKYIFYRYIYLLCYYSIIHSLPRKIFWRKYFYCF